MSNLIVWVDADHLAVIEQQATDMLSRHPARLLLLVADSSQPPGIDAFVSARCHMPGRGRPPVCSEHIVLRAHPSEEGRLASVARSLLVGDLPVTLWWAVPQPPPDGGALFGELAAMSRQVIYDSLDWPQPVAGLAAVARWAALEPDERIISDLVWRRLKAWRRLISQSLDPSVAPGALRSIRSVRIEHGQQAISAAWLLVGWLATRLGWASPAPDATPGSVVARFESPQGEVAVTLARGPRPELSAVELTCGGSSNTQAFRLAHAGATQMEIETPACAAARTCLVRPFEIAELLAHQVADLRGDRVFRDSLAMAGAIAQTASAAVK
jgi:glucose-6-phosphate dehydrogenase assembly protein OpcA